MRRVVVLLLLISMQAMAEVKIEETSFTTEAQSARFIINLTKSTKYKIFRLSKPPRVVIDLGDTRLTSALPNIHSSRSPVLAIRSGIRHDHDLRVVLDVKDKVTFKSRILRPAGNHGYRLVIDLVQKGTTPRPHTRTVANVPAVPSPTTLPMPARETLAKWMEEARQSMAKADYSHAIALYTKILEYPDHSYRQDAQEYLGLARERNGQLAHAKAEYETYLKLYPKGEGADRVRQRLAGLLTARAPAKDKLPKEARRKDVPPWNVRGGFSQFYRRDVSSIEGFGTTVNQSALDSNLDVIAQLTQPKYEIRTRFTGGYRNDFLGSTTTGFGNTSPLRITSLYVDAADRHHHNLGRIGRQSQSRGGVLGRFDGLYLSHQLTPFVKLNLVSGYPVDISTVDRISTETLFYGVNADFGTYSNTWDFNTFAVEQTSEGLLDRRAIGGEVRYFKPRHSALGLVDYDVSYQTLNMILLLGNWLFPDNSSLNVVVDRRKSPILTTRNALIGQLDGSLAALKQRFTEDQIRQLAVDRSADSQNYTVSLTHPLNDKLQISGDLTLSTLSATPASGGIAAIPASGNDWNYSVQLIGSSLIKAGDIAIIGLRMDNNSTSDMVSLNLNTRYPVNQAFRINPRLRIEQRKFSADNSTQWTTAPSVRINYMLRRYFNLEFELGGEWIDRDTSSKFTDYYLSAGYRADF
ncbi:MAG: AMIN domain-containing protein [Gammaproteobacteria bacterium]|jgi:hypothetical protein